jgi:dihydroorotate dehydrogenase electron transfer subunit
MKNVPIVLEIQNIICETPTIKTFIFDWDMDKNGTPNPGEFAMVWNFNNEKPMSISIIDKYNGQIGITVKKNGEFTENLHNLSIGDKLGIRGFYGNGFNTNMENKKVLAIGGGVGMAPINALSSSLLNKGLNVDVLSAATTKEELLFVESLKNKGANVSTCTDDGSCGYKGYASDKTMDLIESSYYDMVFVCGPEIMMKGLFDLLEDKSISAEYSMERYMKCALGLCGQCCIDNKGWRVCVEGPVFNNNQLKEVIELGKYHRDASGTKIHY